MFQRLVLFLFLSSFSLPSLVSAQERQIDSLSGNVKLITDSLDTAAIQLLSKRDTVAPVILRALDSLQRASYDDSVKRTFGYPFFNLAETIKNYRRSGLPPKYQEGNPVAKGEIWVVGVVAVLLLIFAFLKNVFDKQLSVIVQSFFSNRLLSNMNKEDNLFTSWPFLLLFVHFGFTAGLLFYLVAKYQKLDFSIGGFEMFVSISIAIIILYVLKIVALRLLGIFFNVQKPINEYISILYLSYFNASLLCLPLVFAFALSPLQYGKFYMVIWPRAAA